MASYSNVCLIPIDGNIGSGKSTLLEHLKKRFANHPSIIFATEPVSSWEKIKDHKGVTMLEKFYSNQSQYAFPFQMMAFISRLAVLRELVRKADGEPIVIVSERSLYTDKHIFAKMLCDQGNIEDVNYQIYLQWFHEFADDFPIEHCIYIQADPLICSQRIHKRARTGEDTIPLSYLRTCHEYHENYVKMYPNKLVLDGNEDIYEHPEILDDWIRRVEEKILPKSKESWCSKLFRFIGF